MLPEKRSLEPKILNKTHRNVITKLEIPTADPRIQLDVVSSAVFDIHQTNPLELDYALDNTKWHTTDEIYDKARLTYQSIIEPFTELPKVYKFESTKDKLYSYRLENLNGNMRKIPLRSGATSRYLERINKNKVVEYIEDQEDEEIQRKQKSIAIEKLTPEEREEYELETIINPFDPPKPWIRKTRLDGEVVYVNEETKQVKTTAPGEVWAEKYKNLEKLIPREDYSGWEYNEDESEKRKRFRILAEFRKRVTSEIQRRIERPNDLEQVEDALYAVVDTICRREAKKEWNEKQLIKKKKRSTWHPSTINFRLEPLEFIKNTAAADDDDEGIPVITDMEFNDNCYVSLCGYVLPKYRPWNLFIKHENERIKQRLEDEAKEAEKLLIRNQSLKEKWFKLLELAKEDPSHAIHYLIEGLKNRVLEIPTKLSTIDKELLINLLKIKTIQGTKDVIKLLRNPSELFIELPKYMINRLYLKIFPPSQDEIALEKMIKEMTEKDKKENDEEENSNNQIQQGRRKGVGKVVLQDMTPIPITQPDAVLMKILLLHDPPPIYEKIQPPKWYDPALNLQKDLFEYLAEVSGRKKLLRKKKRNPKYLNARARLPLYAHKFIQNQFNERNKGLKEREREEMNSLRSESLSGDEFEGPGDPSGSIPPVTVSQPSDGIGISSNPSNLLLHQVVEEEAEEIDEPSNHDRAPEERGVENEQQDLPRRRSQSSAHENQSIGDINHRSRPNSQQLSHEEEQQQQQQEGEVSPEPHQPEHQGDLESDERSHFSGSTLTTKPPVVVDHHPLPSSQSHTTTIPPSRTKRQSIQSPPPSSSLPGTNSNPATGSNALSGYQLGSLTKRLYDNYKDATIGAAPTIIQKDIFDNTKRKLFEEKLISELSSAACIPSRFFRIEEIRRLPENDQRLYESRKRKEDYFHQLEKEIQEKKRKEVEEYQLTMELIKRSQLLSRQRQEEKKHINSDMTTAASPTSTPQVPSPEKVNRKEESSLVTSEKNLDLQSLPLDSDHPEGEQNEGIDKEEDDLEEEEEEDLDELVGETDEERKARLKASARKKSMWSENYSQSSSLHRSHITGDQTLSVIPDGQLHQQEGGEARGGGGGAGGAEGEGEGEGGSRTNSPTKHKEIILHGQVINLEPSKLAPITQYQLGLTNPEKEIKDPKCWLANELRELTEEERQLKRFKYLQIQYEERIKTKLEIIQEELIKIKHKQNQLLEYCREYVEPKYEEIYRQIHPIKEELSRKIGLLLTQKMGKKSSQQKYQLTTENTQQPLAVQGDKNKQEREEGEQGILVDPQKNENENEEEMVMNVHQRLLNEEQSMLADLAQAKTELRDEEMAMEEDKKEKEKEKENHDPRPTPLPLSTDARRGDDPILCDVKTILRNMLLAVEYHHHQLSLQSPTTSTPLPSFSSPSSYPTPPLPSAPSATPVLPRPTLPDIYDDYLEISDEERLSSQEILIGCEISLIIHIDDSLKQHIYLRDLRSDDISSFLQHQLKDPHSKLSSGQLTSSILDIKHQLLFQKRVNFTLWEDLWVHFISPVYYRYTIKPMKHEKFHDDALTQGRLSNGLIVFNPLNNFTNEQKTTYNRLPQPVIEDDDGGGGGGGGGGGILDYNCDEIGKEISSKLVIYRPNMSSLTNYDVMKCKRIMQLFHEKYLHEMRYGLADGTRLRYGQYLALKDYKTSQRIYELVKQKKSRDERAENGDEQLFKPVITKISPEIFNNWMKEAKDEEEIQLKELRKQALKLKELRKQEAEMRRKYNSQKTWFYGKIFQLNSTIASELASHVKNIIEETEEMIVRGGSLTATVQERNDADNYRKELKIKLIHEEKETKNIWELLCQKYLEEEGKGQREGEGEGEEKEKEDKEEDDDGLTNPTGINTRPQSPGVQSQKSSSSSSLPATLPLPAVLHCLELVKNRKLIDEKYKKYLAKKEIKEKERLKKQKRKEQQERAMKLRQQHEMHTPHTPTPTNTHPNQEPTPATPTPSVEIKNSDQITLSDENSSHLSDQISQLEGDSTSISMSKLEDSHSLDHKGDEEDPDHEHEKEKEKDNDGYSSMSEQLKKFTVKEVEAFAHLSWTQNIWNHSDIYECLQKFPTAIPNMISRDELVQFAKLNIEVCPIIFRAKEEVRKQHEEQTEHKNLQQKRSRSREKKRHDDEKKSKEKGGGEGEGEGEGMMTEEMIYQKMMEEGLAEEAKKRKKQYKKAEKRRLKREKAWLYAHQHMYVKIKGLIPYCAVCREKHDQHWLENYLQIENNYQNNYPSNVNKYKEMKEIEIRERLEKEYIERIEQERKERVQLLKGGGHVLEEEDEDKDKEMDKGKDHSQQKGSSSLFVNYENETSIYSSISIPSLPQSSTELSSSPSPSPFPSPSPSISKNTATATATTSGSPDDERKEISQVLHSLIQQIENLAADSQSCDSTSTRSRHTVGSKKRKIPQISGPIPQYILDSGLSYIDPNGKNIIPTPLTLSASAEKLPSSDPATGTHDDEKSIRSGSSSKKSRKIKKKSSKLHDRSTSASLTSSKGDGFDDDEDGDEDRNVPETLEMKQKRIEETPNSTIYDLHSHEILLKFWNIEFNEKSDFLGYALIPMDILLHPPKGARSFPLQSDSQFVKPGKEKIFLHGNVFVKITPIKMADMRIKIPLNAPDPYQLLLEKRAQMRSNRRAQPVDTQSVHSKNKSGHRTSTGTKGGSRNRATSTSNDNGSTAVETTGNPDIHVRNNDGIVANAGDDLEDDDDDVENYYLPYQWRLEIFRATKMTAMHPIDKNSTICEICWKGVGKKDNEKVYLNDFITIGETSVRTNTVDPDWRNDPSAIHELPPLWTNYSITKRYEPCLNGGWIAKNHIDEIEKQYNESQEKGSTGVMKESDRITQLLLQNPATGTGTGTGTGTEQDEINSSDNKFPSKMTGKLRFKLAANKVLTATKLGQHTIVDLEKKIADLVEVAVFLFQAEEIERQCMAREEKLIRASIRDEFRKLEKPFLEDQRFYEREFSNLIQKIREPPSYLARARFLMGSPMLGGGSVTMCEDPATQEKIDIISIPILYEEDEEELGRNINYLLGNPHENLIKVIEFSVHQVLGFAYTGMATTNQRIAMIICEKIPAISMMEHIDKNWSAFTDEDLHVALLQIVGALVALHRVGILHRNLHPDAVMIKTKSKLTEEESDDDNDDNDEQQETNLYSRRSTMHSMKSSQLSEQVSSVNDTAADTTGDNASLSGATMVSQQSPTISSKRLKLKEKPLYQLTDFWFFHNPRKVGCSYSEGRADWGNRRTIPPEGEGGYKITDKSDIWALGVCIYSWCTRGLHLPITDGQHFDFSLIMKMIPLKWGQWVNSVIKMCLQRNPKFRASASDIYQFLVLTKTKK